MTELASLMVRIGADSTQVNRALTDTNNQLRATGNAQKSFFDSIGQGWKIAGGAALAFGAVSVNAAIDFEEAMTNTNSILKLSQQEIDGLSQEVLDFGATTRAGPQAVAEAFYDIVGGVADASTHMAILEAATATAEAGNADLGGATKALIAVMNSYRFAAEDATFVSDVLTKTVGAGVGSMDEFASAMGMTAGLAASAGIEFDALGASMAYMTTKGFSASQAGARLTAITTAFLKPNEKMKAALKAMGLESGSAGLEMYGLAGMTGRLETALGGSTDAMAEALGTTEALTGAITLNNPEFEDFLGNFEATTEGATAAARAIQDMSTAARMDHLKSQVASLEIQIGEIVTPVLDFAVTATVETLDTWTKDIPEQSRILGTHIAEWINEGAKNGDPFQSFLADIINALKGEPTEVEVPVEVVALVKPQSTLRAQVEAATAAGINTGGPVITPINELSFNPSSVSVNKNIVPQTAEEVARMFNTADPSAVFDGIDFVPFIDVEPLPVISPGASAVFNLGVGSLLTGTVGDQVFGINTDLNVQPAMADQALFNEGVQQIVYDAASAQFFGMTTSLTMDAVIANPDGYAGAVRAQIAAQNYNTTIHPVVTIDPIFISTDTRGAVQKDLRPGHNWDGSIDNNGNPMDSLRSGLSYVPYDGYPAMLHKGEAVLTANQNRAQSGGRGGGVTVNINGGMFTDGPQEFAEYIKTVLAEAGF